jgi:hypothetical protein
VVGTGGAVRPNYPLLVRARPSVHRSDDRTAFDGLKISVSRRVSFIDRSLLRSSFLGPRNVRFNRRLSPPGFRSASQSGGYGALIAPYPEMSCIIYRADLLEHRTGASSGAVTAYVIDVTRSATGNSRDRRPSKAL